MTAATEARIPTRSPGAQVLGSRLPAPGDPRLGSPGLEAGSAGAPGPFQALGTPKRVKGWGALGSQKKTPQRGFQGLGTGFQGLGQAGADRVSRGDPDNFAKFPQISAVDWLTTRGRPSYQ